MTSKEQFQALSPDAPLPWEEHPDIPGIILDANNVVVCEVHLAEGDGVGVAAMIVLAVNAYGGFRDEHPTPDVRDGR